MFSVMSVFVFATLIVKEEIMRLVIAYTREIIYIVLMEPRNTITMHDESFQITGAYFARKRLLSSRPPLSPELIKSGRAAVNLAAG